jgi:hypothetical protein
MGRAFAALLAIVLSVSCPAWGATESHGEYSLQKNTLGSIAGWLRRDGREGWLGADVADALGIPRLATEDLLEALQRGVRNDEALHIAQVSADERRDFLLFTVQHADGRVFFYLASVREGLKGAYVSSRGAVAPLDRIEAGISFQRELRFWEGRVAVR